jgi:hypothetical protein
MARIVLQAVILKLVLGKYQAVVVVALWNKVAT